MNIKVYDTINKFNMISSGDNIIVGLSGGADSVALAHFLCSYKQKKNIKVIAAHINHCIRGEEALRDENFVRAFCKHLGIKLYVNRTDVKKLARECGMGLEECGRKVRYDYFNELYNEFGGKIATAHTLSDSEETVLLNMVRGCGLKGLCGIPPIRGNIIRPLIFVSRDEIESYCKENNLSYVTDSTNLTEDYTRNKIRLNVIPVLKGINASFDNSFRRMILQNSMEEDYLNKLSCKALKKAELSGEYDAIYIRSLPEAIKNRVIVKIVGAYCSGEAQNKHIKAICDIIDSMSGALTLPGDVNISIENERLVRARSKLKKKQFECKFFDANVLTVLGIKFIIEILPIKEYNNKVLSGKLKDCVFLDREFIPDDAVIRNRRQGDIFCQQGRGVTKKVKKLFNELKIPIDYRDSIAMLASGNKVLWIDGVGISEECRIRGTTKFVVIIRREIDNDELC